MRWTTSSEGGKKWDQVTELTGLRFLGNWGDFEKKTNKQKINT